jgi:hypothetical protein
VYDDRAQYPIVDFGGWKRGVGPNCMENEEFFCLSDADFNPYWHCELKG